jgi:hypothetical protein
MNIYKAVLLVVAAALLGLAAGCGTPGRTPSLDPEAVFRQFIDAVNASDATTAASLVAEDATFFDEAGSPTDLVRSLECTAEIVSVDGSGDTLDVELRFTGTTEWKSECDLSPEGTTFPMAVTVEDGKIVDLRDR